MPAAKKLNDELVRIESLYNLNILDSEPEAEFDALVKAAALVCNVPISLIDHDRQWFKANVGLLGVTETPRDLAFCAYAIQEENMLEVNDASIDSRFSDNPLVTAPPNIRFYAGVPLRLSDGAAVGTLCVIDRKPHKLNKKQRKTLEYLALATVNALESRRARQTELKFIDKQKKFKLFVESSAAGTWEWHVQTGECTYNEQWAKMLGYTLAELAPISVETCHQLTHPEDAERAGEALERHFLGETVTYEFESRMRHKDGHWVWMYDRGRVLSWLPDGKPEWMFGSNIDISDRKQQEDALRKSQIFLNRTGKMAGVGGWSVNLTTMAIYWSDEVCQIHGVASGYIPTQVEAFNAYPPDAKPILEAAFNHSIATGEDWDLELPYIKANGQNIWVRTMGSTEFEEGRPKRVFGAFQDITERILQQQAVSKANVRMSIATESGCIGIWEYDIVKETLVWNSWMYHIFGLSDLEQIVSYDLFKRFLHPDDRLSVVLAVQDAIDGIAPYDTEFRIIRADGSVHYIRGTGNVTRDKNGRALSMIGANWDVTNLRELSMQLSEQHEMLRVTLQSIGDAVITTDARGRVTWLNPAAEHMTGWLSSEAKGRLLAQVFNIINEETRKPTENPVVNCLKNGSKSLDNKQTILISRNGAEFGIEDSAAPIRNQLGEILGVVLVFHDVTEQRRLNSEVSYRATHDVLTGLINRSEFESRLLRVLNTAHQEETVHALMYIDLDQFKLVNDACGHSSGDQLLQQVSKLFADCIRSRDTLARLGGDEFAIILEQCSIEQAGRIAQDICDRMDEFRFIHDGQRFRIGTSIGLAPIDHRWANTATLMQAADTSCYAAKEAGRNRVHAWFDSDLAMRARTGETQWAARLEQALEENKFVLFAQRISSIKHEEQGMHAEVLIRMLDHDGSYILPGLFIPAAERFHFASRIDRWVLSNAIIWLKSLDDLNVMDLLCINLSGQSVGDRAFHRQAIQALTEAGEAICQRICLEITETAAITNMTDAKIFIEQARALGVRIALDDFGAGSSSFGYLKTLKVDMLKIDGQFIQHLMHDPLNDATVRCFVDVAKVIGLKTIAEFVDCPEVLTRIREIGVDFAQGFLLHKPEPINNILAKKCLLIGNEIAFA